MLGRYHPGEGAQNSISLSPSNRKWTVCHIESSLRKRDLGDHFHNDILSPTRPCPLQQSRTIGGPFSFKPPQAPSVQMTFLIQTTTMVSLLKPLVVSMWWDKNKMRIVGTIYEFRLFYKAHLKMNSVMPQWSIWTPLQLLNDWYYTVHSEYMRQKDDWSSNCNRTRLYHTTMQFLNINWLFWGFSISY